MNVSVQKLLRAGMMPARTWRAHAVVMSTERLKLRRQMAVAAGKKITTSLSLFMEANGLEVEDELSTMTTQYWAEGVWTGKWSHEQKESWMREIWEVQTWKQLRGCAGTVMCETCDLGIKYLKRCWCQGPDQCTGRSGQQSTSMKSWKREHGSNQGWLPSERKRGKTGLKSIALWRGWSSWKEAGRKKRLIRYWLVGFQSVSSFPDGGRHRKTRTLPLSWMARSEARYSGSLQEMGAQGENVEERMEMTKWYSCTPFSESQWNRGHFTMKMLESEKYQSWGMQVEGVRGLNGGRIRAPTHHQEGGADGLHMLSQESARTHQGACGQQRNNWWITKSRERVYQAKSGRCRLMDQNLGTITWSGRKSHFGRSLRSLSPKTTRKAVDLAKAGTIVDQGYMAVCGQLPLLCRAMDKLWRAQVPACGKEEREYETLNRVVCGCK